MNILITGHLGFVGSSFYKHFVEDGPHSITGVDIKAGPAFDVRDFFRTNNQQYDLVIHLAAIVGGRMTIEGAPLSVAVDLAIDAEMFQWAMRTRPKRIIYYSSSAAYPVSLQTARLTYLGSMNQVAREQFARTMRLGEDDINLNDIESPDFTYGWSKLTGEYLAQFAEADGLRVHVFRPFSGYGETQSLDYPFPSFIHRAAHHVDPFEIWGDGTQVRDFIHIDDVVAATLKAVEEDVPGPVNLGTGRATSFNDLAVMATRAASYQPEFEHKTDNPVGVRYRVADPSKMLAFYTPKITLEEGIERALMMYKR